MCEYGYPRGGRRRSILAALDDRAALRGLQSSLRISPPGHLDNAVDPQHMDGFRHMDGVQLTDGVQHTDGVESKMLSAGISPDSDYDSSGSDAPGEEDVDGASVDGTTETSSSHITSPLGASTQPTSVSSRSHKGKGKGKSRDGRRQRISNACQECKKRKRKVCQSIEMLGAALSVCSAQGISRVRLARHSTPSVYMTAAKTVEVKRISSASSHKECRRLSSQMTVPTSWTY